MGLANTLISTKLMPNLHSRRRIATMDPKEKVNHNLNLCDKTSHKRFTSELIIKLIAYTKKLSNSPILAIPMIYKKTKHAFI